MKILVTGAAGFIGYHTSIKLLKLGHSIIGVDNINNYYSQDLKKNRLKNLKKNKRFLFKKESINNYSKIEKIFRVDKPTVVINLAAEVGVRNSILSPRKHIDVNIYGFFNILELSKKYKIKHLIYASSSSVYGGNKKYPYSEKQKTEMPVSLYAATKKANELMAYSYSNIHNLKTSGLRFFTVYGPWGRPDMAVYSFTEAIIKGKEINLYNNGLNYRDYTYIDDVVAGIISTLKNTNKQKSLYNVFNLGNKKTTSTKTLVKLIEKSLKLNAIIKLDKKVKGDVVKTWADISHSRKNINFKPEVNINEGINKFIEWYKYYNKI